MGLALRREVETELVPGVVAIQGVFHATDAATLSRELPQWLDQVSSALPAESEFVGELGRRLDPFGYDLLDENLGIGTGESEVRRAFVARLWEIAPCVPRVGSDVKEARCLPGLLRISLPV